MHTHILSITIFGCIAGTARTASDQLVTMCCEMFNHMHVVHGTIPQSMSGRLSSLAEAAVSSSLKLVHSGIVPPFSEYFS